jgi:hypothetical protein
VLLTIKSSAFDQQNHCFWRGKTTAFEMAFNGNPKRLALAGWGAILPFVDS